MLLLQMIKRYGLGFVVAVLGPIGEDRRIQTVSVSVGEDRNCCSRSPRIAASYIALLQVADAREETGISRGR